MLPLIALEEHFAAPSLNVGSSENYKAFPPATVSKLEDVSAGRIADMDAASIHIQVLSHVPHNPSVQECREHNDNLASQISQHPGRLKAFANLPMVDPAAATEELERCVKMGFLGALINNHLNGTFYDAEHFWPVFAKAEELEVPIYLHPCYPSEEMLEGYKGNYPNQVAKMLSAYGWGWHVSTGLHILRLFAAGFFDRFPKIRIVIGHMGEMLPFQLERCVKICDRLRRKRGLDKVWRENVWVTTSGMFSLASLRCLLEGQERDHVLFSIDYPFSSTATGRKFFESVVSSGIMSEEELKAFAHGNAEKLLGIKLEQ